MSEELKRKIHQYRQLQEEIFAMSTPEELHQHGHDDLAAELLLRQGEILSLEEAVGYFEDMDDLNG